ncbi:LOW QUALITY PROTEIN: uroplakin-2 [Heptranchias perlo]|uniref:LOW QUALITY PROTEIN: uroplakin-2 n=1 Tax=Heptranchias perlo TaxID=212740 RepID=UPI00355A646D
MKLLILLALASVADAADFNISLVDVTTSGIVANIRSMSAIVTLPPCSFGTKDVTVNVTNSSGGTGPAQPPFVRPICRFKRGLISLTSNIAGISQTMNLGYRIKWLTPDTEYSVVYDVDGQKSYPLLIRTTLPADYRTIDDSFRGRSGAMVVITVLLVLAMVLLLILLIVTLIIKK